jgi:hypothetical protein
MSVNYCIRKELEKGVFFVKVTIALERILKREFLMSG